MPEYLLAPARMWAGFRALLAAPERCYSKPGPRTLQVLNAETQLEAIVTLVRTRLPEAVSTVRSERMAVAQDAADR